MDRAEHLEWAKQRAREYLDEGDVAQAYTSFVSDTNKHPELQYDTFLLGMGMRYVTANDLHGTRRFIEGFN